jgi:hypothetical protein
MRIVIRTRGVIDECLAWHAKYQKELWECFVSESVVCVWCVRNGIRLAKCNEQSLYSENKYKEEKGKEVNVKVKRSVLWVQIIFRDFSCESSLMEEKSSEEEEECT